MRGWILLSPYWKAHEFNLKLSEKKLQLEKRIMLFVKMIVHVTMPKLYFSWSYLHFLSELSLEIAHSSNCPSLPFLSRFFVLLLPYTTPGPICHCLPLHQLIPFYLSLSLSGGSGGPASSIASPALASFFFPDLVIRVNLNTIQSVF